MQKIVIGSDHGGFDLKEKIKEILIRKQIEVKDFGCFSKESCDYPDIGFQVANEVSRNKEAYGILICTSGIGMSMVANRISGVRAALCYHHEAAVLARAHNDANILVMGSRFIGYDEAQATVDAFFKTVFEGARHERRVNKIDSSVPG